MDISRSNNSSCGVFQCSQRRGINQTEWGSYIFGDFETGLFQLEYRDCETEEVYRNISDLIMIFVGKILSEEMWQEV
jgi:hypothetical protein